MENPLSECYTRGKVRVLTRETGTIGVTQPNSGFCADRGLAEEPELLTAPSPCRGCSVSWLPVRGEGSPAALRRREETWGFFLWLPPCSASPAGPVLGLQVTARCRASLCDSQSLCLPGLRTLTALLLPAGTSCVACGWLLSPPNPHIRCLLPLPGLQTAPSRCPLRRWGEGGGHKLSGPSQGPYPIWRAAPSRPVTPKGPTS